MANQGSAVIDLNDADVDVGGSDMSDYETNFSETKPRAASEREEKKSGGGYMDAMRQRFQENVTSMMWQSGKQQATKAWSLYGNIDFLRPYFDVEPHQVRTRLLYSLIPQKATDERQRVARELYGPLMVIFTLIALLLFQMKTADHRVEDGTLMGTAFGVCFTYWFGASAFVWFLCYVCNSHMAMLQILSMMGYAMFSHCIVVFLGTVIHTSHDHIFFYLLWAIIGGLASLKMVCIMLSRTHGQTQRMIVCGAVIALHLLFLLYLHFAYHQIVEDLTEVFGGGAAMDQRPAEVPPDVQQQVADANVERAADGVQDIVRKVTQAAVKAADSLHKNAAPVLEGMAKSLNESVLGGAAGGPANQGLLQQLKPEKLPLNETVHR